MKRSAILLLGSISTLGLAAGTFASASAQAPAVSPGGRFVGTIPWVASAGISPQADATISWAAARAAAVAAVPGTAGTPEAIYDHGYVVYRLIVTAADGTQTEVIVDAGNGVVLDHYSPPQWNGLFGALSSDTPAAAPVAAPVATTGTSTPATMPGGRFVGSIAWDATTGESPQQEATVTHAQAQAAAVAAVPGSVGTPMAIFDHGYVVYRLIVTAADGTKTEVIVDGGNATVLDHYSPPQWNGLFGSLSN